MYGPGIDEVLIVDGSGRPMPEKAIRCVDERAALTAFCDPRCASWTRMSSPVWNTIDFDFTVAPADCNTTTATPFLSWGRDAGELRIRRAEGYFGSGQAHDPRSAGPRRYRSPPRCLRSDGKTTRWTR